MSQYMPAGWKAIISFLVGLIFIYLWLRGTAPKLAPSVMDATDPPPRREVFLTEVTHGRDEINTDIDIIAIHGLDTTSRDTWIWKNPRDPTNKDASVDWLKHLLPSKLDRARIFTCDWPSDILMQSDSVPMRIEEYSLLLLEGIKSSLLAGSPTKNRPIFFIASCLGGLVLIRALAHANDKGSGYYRLRIATRGIVFLATPFRGTSFQHVANWAQAGLQVTACFRGRAVSQLLESVKGSTFQLEETVNKFTLLCQDRYNPCDVFTFYELGLTSLPHKVFPWLPEWLQRKQLVDRSSATLDIISNPLPLNRPHSLMNKFQNSQCPDYIKVADKILDMVLNIRAGTLLEQADKFISEQHYTAVKLKIERLSGERLAMGQCYINLAVVEQSCQEERRTEERAATSSQFSIFARQRVMERNKTTQAELAAIFNERRENKDVLVNPRRILIRGRAGVGKTTLCKRIVHDFTHNKDAELYGSWRKLFDRVLWVPLRRLKIQPVDGWSFENLFYHEYFKKAGLEESGRQFAKELCQALLNPVRSRTLFILDGLDEVSGAWPADDYRAEFLTELLNQPAVIVTSRPSATLPSGVHGPDLELETIGFYPDQVSDYIRTVFTDMETVGKVESFLQGHWLMQGLVRIPIQLDALCYTWDELELKSKSVPKTMTEIYEQIERKLWKKDVLRLNKRFQDGTLTDADIQDMGNDMLQKLVKDEVDFLECLAFSGLHNDIIDFSSDHLDEVLKFFDLEVFPQKILPNISFLRASDSSPSYANRNYHFIHLTFQEYFAARYFVRQWGHTGELHLLPLGSKDRQAKAWHTAKFLQKHKYTARYDVFWRLVAGLLDTGGQAAKFMSAIEEGPLDLLGPTHQRLVMHCLSEISSKLPMREMLENRLRQWLDFECRFNYTARLSREEEFPEQALKHSLFARGISEPVLRSLRYRASIPESILELLMAHLDNEKSYLREVAFKTLINYGALSKDKLHIVMSKGLEDYSLRESALVALETLEPFPYEVLSTVAAWVNDTSKNAPMATSEAIHDHGPPSSKSCNTGTKKVYKKISRMRTRAIAALGGQPTLPNDILMAMVSWLNDEGFQVRAAAIKSLGRQPLLPEDTITAITTRIHDKASIVRKAAIVSLGRQPSLPGDILLVIASRLHDTAYRVRKAALESLGRQPTLPNDILIAIASRLNDDDHHVRTAAIESLGRQPMLPIDTVRGIASKLTDEYHGVKIAAIKVISRQPTVPSEIIKLMEAQLYDKDWNVRMTALQVLGRPVALPNEVELNSEDWKVRAAAVRALGRQSLLSNKLLTSIAELFHDESSSVRNAAVEALSGRAKLPDEAIMAIATRLEDNDEEMRTEAIYILAQCQELPEEVLMALLVQLKDKQVFIRNAILHALGTQTRLPDKALMSIADCLNDVPIIQQRAIDILIPNHSNFYRGLLTGPLIASLYRHLLRRSFVQHIVWYKDGDSTYINLPGCAAEFSFSSERTNVRELIKGARPPGYPSAWERNSS